MFDLQEFRGNYRNEDCCIKIMPSTTLSFRPAGEIFKGAGNIRTSQDSSLSLGMAPDVFSDSQALHRTKDLLS